jgi:hypothetical protein
MHPVKPHTDFHLTEKTQWPPASTGGHLRKVIAQSVLKGRGFSRAARIA